MKVRNDTRRGFTLIELLTVIAIIAILAAIIFPVFNRVREGVRQKNCMSNLHNIGQSLKLYYEDNARYPAALYGFVEYDSGKQDSNNNPIQQVCPTSQVVAMDKITYQPLMHDKKADQKYMQDKGIFLCPDSPYNDPAAVVSNVLYPHIPQVPNRETQTVVYSPTMVHVAGDITCYDSSGNSIPVPDNTPASFYRFDSYDTGPRVNANGQTVTDSGGQPITELHYSLDWTGGNASNPQADSPNQMKYPLAPEDKTVVTWCSYHAPSSSQVIVLFLNGQAKPVPVGEFVSKGPLGF